jgi:hypothetical protein
LRHERAFYSTTSAVEFDFPRLRGAKPDYRNSLSCLALEDVMQASDFMLIAGKVDVSFKFHTIPN